MSSTQGISTLLEAEKEAAKIVQKAKQYRVQRLKDARTEAVKEIDALKAQKNVEYKAYEAEASIPCAMLINHSGETDQSLAQTQQQTEQSIAEIRKAFAENKDTVIAKLLDSVVNVQPTVHQNAKV